MENIRVFLDTGVLINWLAREVDPNTGRKLWENPYRILKMVEGGKNFRNNIPDKPDGNNLCSQEKKEIFKQYSG